MDDTSQNDDICRVCRCEGQQDRPLFYPCICTGSIKYIHQDCLMQWMRYSHKEYCELCGHRFSFQPIYAADMPRVLPIKDVIIGLMAAVIKGAKGWFHYTLVGFAWFGIVPVSAYRTYRYLFRATSMDMILSLPFDMFTMDSLPTDAFRGCFVVTCTLLSFIGLVWLREQILHGGGPDWLERDDAPPAVEPMQLPAAQAIPLPAPPVRNERNAAAANEENDDVDALPAANEPGAAALAANDVGVAHEAAGNLPAANVVGRVAAARQFLAGAIDDARAVAARRDAWPAAGAAQRAAPLDVPMDNAAPPVANPADNEGEQPLEPAVADAPAANAAAGAVAAGAAPAAAAGDNENDEPNWNPMEWDRAAEELTWERLLGLDGSLIFLEHVFWIISLNTMFIFTFAFCPHAVGHFFLGFIVPPEKLSLHFHGLLVTLFGYCAIGVFLVMLHFLGHIFQLRRMRWFVGICYIVVKVSMLSVVEIGVLPLICGWWLDICSLPLFDASIKDRKANFRAAPGTSLFVHWMFGMIYVYYFAGFISLLREVLRPGVLWIFRNVNDPDFSPIQEMIHVPILRHVRRLIASAMIFGFSVLLTLWLPIRLLKTLLPTFLPYTLSGDSEVNDLSLQLMLLQIVLPGFFEQSHTRVWLKAVVRVWCATVAWLLGIRSYLLGSNEQQQQQQQQQAQAQQNQQEPQQREQEVAPAPQPAAPAPEQAPAAAHNLGAVHQAIMQRDVNVGFQPYDRPTFFPLRLCGLLLIMCVSIIFGAILILTVPVWIGRRMLSLWSTGGTVAAMRAANNAAAVANGTAANAANPNEHVTRPHELYTAELGAYLCWLISRGISIAVQLLPQGRAAVFSKIRHWLRVTALYAWPVFILVLLLGVIPLLFGLLLELVVVIPLRVPIFQTPVHFLWQDWALGVLYTKIAVALTLMGPDWQLKRAIERAYRDGLRDINVRNVINELAIPVIEAFGLALAIPYVLAHTIIPLFVLDPFFLLSVERLVYPTSFLVVGGIAYVMFEIGQFKKLYQSIKVDKYLVGQRLVNYEHRKRQQEAKKRADAAAAAAAAAAVVAGAPEDGAPVEAAAEPPVVPPVQ